MEYWRKKRVENVLRDYCDTDKYIAKLEEEITYPWTETDVNADIKGTKISPDNKTVYTITQIDTHRQIAWLRKSKLAVDNLLYECGTDTETIIRELYIKRFPRYTMQGLVDSYMIKCGLTKAKQLKNDFFEKLDRQLDM